MLSKKLVGILATVALVIGAGAGLVAASHDEVPTDAESAIQAAVEAVESNTDQAVDVLAEVATPATENGNGEENGNGDGVEPLGEEPDVSDAPSALRHAAAQVLEGDSEGNDEDSEETREHTAQLLETIADHLDPDEEGDVEDLGTAVADHAQDFPKDDNDVEGAGAADDFTP